MQKGDLASVDGIAGRCLKEILALGLVGRTL